MEFYTVSKEKRPVRLCEETRQFAWDSLHGRYGDESQQTPAVLMDDIPGFESYSPYARHDAAIRRIAEQAPLRICPAERVSGAATLGMGINHLIPATFRGEALFSSVSHVTPGFDKVVRQGLGVTEAAVKRRLKEDVLSPEQRELLESMESVLESLRIWRERYLQVLGPDKSAVRSALMRVPFEPAGNFFEAVQSLWFTFAFTRLCGNWPGIGRIDEMLGNYLRRDLEAGVLTLDEAREILAGLFIKGCEWIRSDTPPGSGDAQHYQNIVLSGVDADGQDVTNEVSYLVLDIVEELGISDFPITVRLNEHTPRRLLDKIAQVMRHGGGVVAVYNETLILDSLTRFGYSSAEARRFANDGCWEVQVPGKTFFTYIPFDALRILLEDTLHLDSIPAHYDSFDALYADFSDHLRRRVEAICRQEAEIFLQPAPGGGWEWKPSVPCTMISLLTEGCMESGRSYFSGGPVYKVTSPHIGGAPDVGNSLQAIDQLVFREKKISFDELMQALQLNWEGYEELRRYAGSHCPCYGNDDDKADAYTVRVLNDFAAVTASMKDRLSVPILFPPGVSTFGRQIEWAPYRAAVPFGRKKGDVLSGNASPTPGTEMEGATAVVRSYCKTNLLALPCGAALDLKLHPTSVEGENGVEALVGLLRGFVRLGGFFMQPDIMDAEILRQAQAHPEDYRTLSVRVSGWNARFVTLDREWQNMVINQNAGEI